MIWSTKHELLATLDRVKKHCTHLQQQEKIGNDNDRSDGTGASRNIDDNDTNKNDSPVLPTIAPGVQEDYERHKNDPILTDPRTWMKQTKSTEEK